MEDLEACVAALEASHADYRAVLAAVNALGVNQREHSLKLTGVDSRLTGVESRLTTVESELAAFRQETRTSVRSLEEGQAEIKDLLVRALDR